MTEPARRPVDDNPHLATALATVRELMGGEALDEVECHVTKTTVRIVARRGGKVVSKHRWEAR